MSLVKKIVNIPFVWNLLQKFVGATEWKLKLYPLVFKKKGRILDFGCSTGPSTPAFLDFDYTGVDVDPQAIAAATKRFSSYENVKFVCANLLTEPIGEREFDHVLVACTTHHLSDKELETVMPILLGKLKKGGELHIFDPLSQPEKDGFITKLFIRYDQGRHIRTLEENKKIFAPYGISELKVFPSPDRFIKLEDMLYMKLVKV